jgi:hypothetical protein
VGTTARLWNGGGVMGGVLVTAALAVAVALWAYAPVIAYAASFLEALR